jgi:hypothetical protein
VNARILLRIVLSGLLVAAIESDLTMYCQPASQPTNSGEAILSATQVNKFLPDTFFFHGEQMFVEFRTRKAFCFRMGCTCL